MRNEKTWSLAYIFQETMADILRRRAIIETLELMGMREMNGALEERIREDYLRVQLEDLRKFFDLDSRVYRLTDLIKMTNNDELRILHKKLFNNWAKKYESLANNIYFHLNRTEPAYEDVTHDGLNSFIDNACALLEAILKNLNKRRKIPKRVIDDFGEYKYEKIEAAILFQIVGESYPKPPSSMYDVSMFLGLSGRSAKKMYCHRHHKIDTC